MDLGSKIKDLLPKIKDLDLQVKDLGPKIKDLGPEFKDMEPKSKDLGPILEEDLGSRDLILKDLAETDWPRQTYVLTALASGQGRVQQQGGLPKKTSAGTRFRDLQKMATCEDTYVP